MFKKTSEINDSWFYSTPNWLLRQLHIYVKGDALVILPLILLIVISGFFSIKFMLLEIGVFLSLRGLGEMIYWLLQQFGDHKYRPQSKYKNLNNNSAYILYQLYSFRNTFIGILIICFTLLYL